MEEKEQGIKEKLDIVIKKQEEIIAAKKVKRWKLPWGKSPSKAQISKGYTTVQIIRNNGEMDFIKAPIDDGTVTVDGIPRISTIDYKMSYKGKPWLIIPEWSLKPFSPVENYDQTEKDKLTTTGTRLILAKMEKEAIKPTGKGFGNMGWIILIIAVCAVGYYLYSGGKLF